MAAAEEPQPRPRLTIGLFEELQRMQATHGLRSGDLTRYRQYCQRRIRRTCKVNRFLHGNAKQYIPREVTPDLVKGPGLVVMLLLEAERAWAYSEELKEGSADKPRKRHHQVARLKRAAKWARQLRDLTVAVCDGPTQAQAEAYHEEKAGAVQMLKGNYEESLAAFTRAATTLAALAHAALPAVAEAVAQRAAEVQQNRRLCAYKLGMDVDLLEAASAVPGAGGGGGAAPSDLTWHGRAIRFPSEKLRQKAREAQDRTEAIAAGRAKAPDFTAGNTALNHLLEQYDKLFIAYHDAVALAKQDLRNETADSAQQRLILNYFSTLLLEQTIQRNLLLVEAYTQRYAAQEREKASKAAVGPADVVRLFDLLVQNAQDLLATPGVEDDPEMGPAAQAALLLYRATRLYWKAEAFRHAAHYTEALACVTAAEQLLTEGLAFRQSHTLDTADVNAIADKVRTLKCVVQGSAVMLAHKKGEQITQQTADLSLHDARPKRKLVDCLDEFVDCESLISIPIEPPCVPCKPLFYDVAANFLTEVDITPRLSAKRRAQAEAAAPVAPVKAAEEPVVEKKGGWLSSFWS